MRLTGSGVPGPPPDMAEAAVSCVERSSLGAFRERHGAVVRPVGPPTDRS